MAVLVAVLVAALLTAVLAVLVAVLVAVSVALLVAVLVACNHSFAIAIKIAFVRQVWHLLLFSRNNVIK